MNKLSDKSTSRKPTDNTTREELAAVELLHEAKLLETAARRFALGHDVSSGYVLSMCARIKQAIAAAESSTN